MMVKELCHLSVIFGLKSQHRGTRFVPPLSIVVCHLMYLCCLNNVNTKDCNIYTAFQVLNIRSSLFYSWMQTNL